MAFGSILAGRYLAACMVGLLVLAARSPGQAPSPRIGKIVVDRHTVFDADDSTTHPAIASMANAIHISTKEYVIRRELLYQEGDVFNRSLAKETERNLRALGFLGDVDTQVDTMADSTLAVTVHTHDKWTLSVSPSYQTAGGVTSVSLTMKDDNLLGRGQSLSAGYSYRDDLQNPHAGEIIFKERRLFGSRWGTALQHKSSQDERVQSILLDHSFYTESASWAASLYADYAKLVIPFYEGGVRTRERQLSQHNQTGYIALSFGEELKLRPAIAFIQKRSSGINLSPMDNLSLVNVSLQLMSRRFDEDKFLDNFGRVEDVPKGLTLSAVFGKNFSNADIDPPQYFVRAGWMQALSLTGSYYLACGGSYSSLLGGSPVRETTLSWMLLQHVRVSQRHLIAARLSETLGSDWSQDRQLVLGSSAGLRGYGNYTLTGQRLALYNIEYRWYSGPDWWIFRPGVTLFVDGGTAWNEQNARQFHHAAGFGFRIENTKQQGSGILRIDIAFNFDERRFTEISISSRQLFSAFAELGFLPPNILQ